MATLRSFRIAPNLPNTLVLEGAVIAELVTDDGTPVAGEPCHVTLPGESEPRVGFTDARGRFCVPHALELACQAASISFPKLDQDSWEEAPVQSGDETETG